MLGRTSMNADVDPWSTCIRLKARTIYLSSCIRFLNDVPYPSCIRIYIYVVVMANHDHVMSPRMLHAVDDEKLSKRLCWYNNILSDEWVTKLLRQLWDSCDALCIGPPSFFICPLLLSNLSPFYHIALAMNFISSRSDLSTSKYA